MLRIFSMAIAGVLLTGVSAEAQILKREPAEGGLRPGQIVLVDDGSCPRGQVLEVTAAANRNQGRARRCVPRPR